jgi:hypothetical protein
MQERTVMVIVSLVKKLRRQRVITVAKEQQIFVLGISIAANLCA